MLPDGKAYCVVMHDVAPATWGQCEKLLDALAGVASFPATLLLVPRYHRGLASKEDREFCARMSERHAAGDELVLHGLTHRDEVPLVGVGDTIKRRFYTAGEGEFATLSEVEARSRLQEGLCWFDDEGWQAHGFVAPAWLMSEGTWRALKTTSFLYTTTLGGFHLLDDSTKLKAQSLVFSSRSAWRRAVSHVWADVLAKRLAQAPLIRFGLHPIDADYPLVVRHWQRLLGNFSQTHRPTTKAAFARRLRQARLSKTPPMQASSASLSG